MSRGALLTGDTITVVLDRDWVSFMWSYPNHIPLDEATVLDIARSAGRFAFDGCTAAGGAGSLFTTVQPQYAALPTATSRASTESGRIPTCDRAGVPTTQSRGCR